MALHGALKLEEPQAQTFTQMLMAGLFGPGGAAFPIATGIFGSAIDELFGRGPKRREAERDLRQAEAGLRGRLGKDIFNPSRAARFVELGAGANLTRLANMASTGTSAIRSNDFYGALQEQLNQQMIPQLADLYVQNMLAKAQQDMAIYTALLNSATRRLAAYS